MRNPKLLICALVVAGIGWTLSPIQRPLELAGTMSVPYSTGGKPVPTWASGTLVGIDSMGTASPVVLATDRKGQQVFAASLTIPDSSRTYAHNWTRGQNGKIAVVGTAWDAAGRGSAFLALLSPGGTTERVIRTDPYYPYRVAVAPDGSIWTAGFEMINMSLNGTDPNGGVVRHFDGSGQLIGSYLPMSSFGMPRPQVALRVGNGRMAASQDRIGWVSFEVKEQRIEGSYIEVAPDGAHTVFSLPDVPKREPVEFAGFALTNSNQAMLALRKPVGGGVLIYELNRGAAKWDQLALPQALAAAKWCVLYGSDNSDLVFALPPSLQKVLFYSLDR